MSTTPSDPMEFLKTLWGNTGMPLPGLVTPTLDTNELDKRIADLKAVEGWLKTNLGMLQMTIQGLEMQRTTVSAVQTMGKMAADAAKSMTPEATAEEAAPPPHFFQGVADPAKGSLSDAAMWPWQMMQQMRDQMQQHADAAAQATQAAAAAPPAAKPKTTRSKK